MEPTPLDDDVGKKGEAPKEPSIIPRVVTSPTPNDKSEKCRYSHTPWWKTTAEIIGIGAVIWYAFLTNNMWREMQEQTRIQRKTTINSERAWVGLDIPVTLDAIEIAPKAIRINGHYTVKNFGHGPALKVMQFGNFVDLDATMEIQKREADSYCDSAVKFTTGTVPVGGELKQPPPFGYTLFPSQSHTELIQVTGQELPEKTATFLRFIGCVAYLDQFKETHWTRFCMERKPGTITPVGQIPKLDFCAMYNDTDQPKEQ